MYQPTRRNSQTNSQEQESAYSFSFESNNFSTQRTHNTGSSVAESLPQESSRRNSQTNSQEQGRANPFSFRHEASEEENLQQSRSSTESDVFFDALTTPQSRSSTESDVFFDALTTPSRRASSQQRPETLLQRTKKSVAKVFDASKALRNKLAQPIKQNEPFSDQCKYLGQYPSGINMEQFGLHNLPANAKKTSTLLGSLPASIPGRFEDVAAVIGMTRDVTKSASGLLQFPDYVKDLSNSKKTLKDAFNESSYDGTIAAGKITGTVGELISAITYTGIAITQARKGCEHHRLPSENTTLGSGAIVAAKYGGKLGGTSLPFDIGKATASSLGALARVSKYTDFGWKAIKEDKLRDYKSWFNGVSNAADLTKALASAAKDIAGLANSIKGSARAKQVQIYTGGLIVPSAHAALGAVDLIEGINTFSQTYKSYKNYETPSENSVERGTIINPNTRHREQEKLKMKYACINTFLGALQLSAGVAGLTGGTEGLFAATVMGGALGTIQLGKELFLPPIHESDSESTRASFRTASEFLSRRSEVLSRRSEVLADITLDPRTSRESNFRTSRESNSRRSSNEFVDIPLTPQNRTIDSEEQHAQGDSPRPSRPQLILTRPTFPTTSEN